MTVRIFVNVVGFSDVERHALNTVFRLSRERDTQYELWMPDAPEPAQLALVDGQSDLAHRWLASVPAEHEGELFWVGQVAPAHAARVFQRPLHWPDVVAAMDGMFAPAPGLDFDLGAGSPPPDPDGKRALIVDADRDSRLYFRAKLSSAGIHTMDEATSAAQGLEMLRAQPYDLAILDSALPDPGMNVWQLATALDGIKPTVPMVLVLVRKRTIPLRVRGWFAGVQAVLPKPPHPGKLLRLLQKV